MPNDIEKRMEVVERVMIESEGAQFATRHLLSALLATVSEREVKLRINELTVGAQARGAELGERRLRGYLDELSAIRDSIGQFAQRVA